MDIAARDGSTQPGEGLQENKSNPICMSCTMLSLFHEHIYPVYSVKPYAYPQQKDVMMGLLVFLSMPCFAYILPSLHLLPVVSCTSVPTSFCTFRKYLFDIGCNLKVHIQLLKSDHSYQQISQFEVVMFSALHTYLFVMYHT